MLDWKKTYEELKKKKTIYGIADEGEQDDADNYFDWLKGKYPAIDIENSRNKVKKNLIKYFGRSDTDLITDTLRNVIKKETKKFQTGAEKQIEELFKNKSSNQLIANFQSVDNGEIESLKKKSNSSYLNPESVVFFTNALIEELYLKTLPEYFEELLKSEPQKSFNDLSGIKWEESKKKLFNVLHVEFTGCESKDELENLDKGLDKCVKELEEIIKLVKLKPTISPIPPISSPGGDDEVNKAIKEIETVINSFRNKNHTGRDNNERSTLINVLEKKRDWISAGTKAQKEAVIQKYDDLRKTIEDLELEILQHKAIQKIKDELNDKRNGNEMKLTENDLIEQDYINFASKIFQLKSKEEVDDFKDRVIEEIISLREPYSLLDKIIAKGEKALSEKNHELIQNALGTLETYYGVASNNGEKAYEQKSEIINDLKTRLLRVLLVQARQLHVSR